MKTLDEVINALTLCTDWDAECKGCPYRDDNKGGLECVMRNLEEVLHYLKEYRERLQNLQDMMDLYEINDRNYQEAVQNCEMVQLKYQQLLDDYNDNPALTWDELQTMKGKPVWIDSVPLVRRWVIIKKFHPIGGNHNLFDMEVEDGSHFLRKSMGKDTTKAWWQAYRKERS